MAWVAAMVDVPILAQEFLHAKGMAKKKKKKKKTSSFLLLFSIQGIFSTEKMQINTSLKGFNYFRMNYKNNLRTT